LAIGQQQVESATVAFSVRQLAGYFLHLGSVGFGGPVALTGAIHRDLVELRGWVSDEEYRQGLALSQLMPGPLAAQLAIYLGFIRHGIKGATVAGVSFVLPSFIMVVLLGMAYRTYGGLPWMHAIFYGVGAGVIGIIARSAWRLAAMTVSPLTTDMIRQHWLLWLFFALGAAQAIFLRKGDALFMIGSGLIYMMVKSPPAWLRRSHFPLLLLLPVLAMPDFGLLAKMALFFAKAGAFVFGSGLAIIPFLHKGLVLDHGWLTEQEFLDAVAVAMTTPGPLVVTVGFIGYLMAGLPGACVAALASFLPCYLLTVLPAPYFSRIASNMSVQAFVRGITAAVIGALAGSVLTMGSRTIIDVPSALIALGTLLCLIYVKQAKELHLILLSAAVGLLLHGI
jgi:chromate transporter